MLIVNLLCEKDSSNCRTELVCKCGRFLIFGNDADEEIKRVLDSGNTFYHSFHRTFYLALGYLKI